MATKTKEVIDTIKIHNTDELIEIPIENIHPSPLEPQIKRRARITPDELGELVLSIKKHGLINPITVRQIIIPRTNGQKFYEIVAGERRWMATKQANHLTILAIVKNLSDADAEEIQLSENLDRTDLHPLDEAFWFKYLMAKENATLTDVALKVGKSEAFVHQRLKLNDLCAQAMTDFADGFLPIGHAMEIAKYPEDLQTEILKYNCYHNNDRIRSVKSDRSEKAN